MKNKKKIKKQSIVDEFKQFIMRGNVIDLAVGVIVGGAFSKIVSSLVDNVLMPFIGIIIGGIDFSSISINIKDATINYGLFLQNIIDFLIISACIFVMIKIINRFTRKEENKNKESEKKEVVKSAEVILLEEIRDILKNQNK